MGIDGVRVTSYSPIIHDLIAALESLQQQPQVTIPEKMEASRGGNERRDGIKKRGTGKGRNQ